MAIHGGNVLEYHSQKMQEINNIMYKNHPVNIWLNDIGLTEYFVVLKGEGYETVQALSFITEKDLRDLKITKQMHVKKILNKINDMNNTNGSGANEGDKTITINAEEPSPTSNNDEAPPAYTENNE